MKKVFIGIIMSTVFLSSCSKDEKDPVNSNSPKEKYVDALFNQVDITTVTYSDTFNLAMDIYSPGGDTSTSRRVIFLGHGGSFYTGSKTNPTMVHLATEFAKRGYVAVSIDYRKASNITLLLDSITAASAVVKAVQDGKAAIRYMRSTIAMGNPFGIDGDKFLMGGNSAGGVLAMQAVYLEASSTIPTHLDSIITAEGGLEGHSGSPGYSSSVRGVLSLAGAINRDFWVTNKGFTIVAAHGDQDGVVPYGCDDIYQGYYPQYDLIQLCGGEAIKAQADIVGESCFLKTIVGADHVPWQDNLGYPNALMDEVMEFAYPKLKTALD